MALTRLQPRPLNIGPHGARTDFMKGIIFNLLEDVVSEAHGPGMWDALLQDSGASGVYTSLGSYPDEELVALVHTAAAQLGLPPADVLRWFGRNAIPRLARFYPGFFTSAPNLRAFMLSLNQVIHAEVRKLYPGSVCPHFDFGLGDGRSLEMVYRSPRRLCALIEGFVQGVAEHYREPAVLTHAACMHQGAPACVFRLQHATPHLLTGAASAAA
jgi:hypothetical protein